MSEIPDDNWKEKAQRAAEVMVEKYAFNLAYIHGYTPEEIAEIAADGARDGSEMAKKYPFGEEDE